MKFKKFLCMLMMASLVLSSNVNAASPGEPIGDEFSPMYTNMTSVAADLAISGGYATCVGSYIMTKSKNSTMEVTLLRSDGSLYKEVKTWTQSNTGTGSFGLSRDKSVTKGYDYRVRVIVKVYSGSTLVETGACYSHIISYK